MAPMSPYGPVILAPGVDMSGLRPDTLRDFSAMARKYHDLTGRKIGVNSAYRSTVAQAALFSVNPLKAAKPGRSMHEFGYALDINSSDANKLNAMGLLGKYGFWRPLMRPSVRNKEPWHIEPKGLKYSMIRAAGYTVVRAGGGAFLLFLLGLFVFSQQRGER